MDGQDDRVACPLSHLTSRMICNGIMKRPDATLVSCSGISGLLLDQRPARGMRVTLCTQLCCPRSLSHLRLANTVPALTVYATDLMTYPHSPPCTITHYSYFDSLYSHSITTTTSSHSTSALPTLIPHSLPLTCPPSASCIMYAIATGIVCRYCLLARRVPGVESNASNTKRIFETHGSDLCEIRMTEAGP